MKNITCELRAFLEATGLRQRHLSKMSGVSAATINRLVNGAQCDVRLSTAEALRSAMLTLKAAAPDKETVAEELADDVQGLGRWADVCTDPTASKAEVEREAAALVDEIIETKELKLREKS